jgi:hypothetical protein
MFSLRVRGRGRTSALGVLCLSSPAWAADAPASAPAAPVSEAELRALTEALGADAQAVQAGSASAPAAASGGTKPAAPAASGNTGGLDLALILDVAGAWFSDDEPLPGRRVTTPITPGFTFQQLELSMPAPTSIPSSGSTRTSSSASSASRSRRPTAARWRCRATCKCAPGSS